MKHLSDVPDDEIRKYMDFDKLVQRHTYATRMGKLVKGGIAISTVIIIAVTTYYISTRNDRDTTPQKQDAVAVPLQLSEAIASDSTVTQYQNAPAEQSQQLPKSRSVVTPEGDVKKPVEKELPPIPASTYAEAQPVDGYDALFQYFQQHLHYPQEAIRDSIEGVLHVSFVINKEGKPQSIEFTNSLGAPFEKEARMLIENMPLWKPAMLNGKPVNSRLSLPLTFELKKIKQQ